MNELLRKILNLPPQASTVARDIDYLHYFVISVTMAGAFFVTLLAVIFLLRFRKSAHRGRRSPRRHDKRITSGGTPMWLEAIIIGGLLSIFCLFWVIGFRQYVGMRAPPADSMEIYVTAKKWMWSFAYRDGTQSNGVLYVPVNQPVKLIMSSRDVIHSFYVPEFRIKQDVVPGRMTTVWFEATLTGTYPILCTEYCGTGHSAMLGRVEVLPESDFAGVEQRRSWRTSATATPLAQVGEQISAEHGCLRCHTVDGTPHIGPTWAGAYRSVVPLGGGGQAIADEAYLTESMMDPLAALHEGFEPVMPSYQGLLTSGEVAAIVEFIKSLREVRPDAVIDPPPTRLLQLQVEP